MAAKHDNSTDVVQSLKEASVKKGKKKMRPSIAQYYCRKCYKDGMDHMYEDCPKWCTCCFCNAKEHWSFLCTTLHNKCTVGQCLIQISHCYIGEHCPTSGISCTKEYAYMYKDEGGRVVVSSVFNELDWQSFHE